MKRLLHALFPWLHRWEVEWNDDDVCRRCGTIRYWPSGLTAPWWRDV